MSANPVLRSYRARILYAGIWVLIIGIQTLAVCSLAGLSFARALVDSAVFDSLFACFIGPLWYFVRFNGRERPGWYSNIVTHLSAACIFIVVWLSAGSVVMYALFSNDADYLSFLRVSLRWKAVEGLLFYAVAVPVYYLHIYAERLNEKAVNEILLNELLKDGELNLLKSQINPHFLFNGLNSVNSLIVRNPEQAQKMLVALSDYLRYAVLSINRMYSRVDDEMENIARYLAVEKLRFGEKLVYEAEIEPDCLPVEIPAMLLQPLFENAVKHGVYESLQTVRIAAKITKDARYLNIGLSNDFDAENTSPKKGSGTGLRNIRERLRLMYGDSAALHVKPDAGKFIVMMKIPLAVC